MSEYLLMRVKCLSLGLFVVQTDCWYLGPHSSSEEIHARLSVRALTLGFEIVPTLWPLLDADCLRIVCGRAES